MNIDLRVPSMIPDAGIIQAAEVAQQQRRVANIGDEEHRVFDHFLQAAMDVLNETNLLQIESDVAQVNFATGQSNDMLTVILAQERAGSALNFTVQITNRIIEAYREIMRMQV